MISSFKDLKYYIRADLYRYMTSSSLKTFIRGWFIPGFRFTFHLRVTQYFSQKRWLLPLFLFFRLRLRHYQFKYGISIHHTSEIGPGLYIGHFGGIIVNPNAIIGRDCNIAPNVLIGLSYSHKEKKFKYPVIGNRVYLANGSKILGGVTMHDDSMATVGAIVTKDVPPMAVVGGNPAEIKNYYGSATYCGSVLK